MKSKLKLILMVGFFIRFILLFIDQYVTNLPQSGQDSVRFQLIAIDMMTSNDYQFIDIINNGAFFFPFFGSILYSFFGISPFLWGFILLLLGLGVIYNVHRAVFIISNDYKLANKAAWIAALFPNLAVLSVVILRECPIHYFISLAILFLVKYIKYHKAYYVIGFIIATVFASLFHSGLIVVFLGFVLYNTVFNKRTKFILKFFILILSVTVLYYMNTTGFGLGKIGGSFDAAFDIAFDGGIGLNESGGSNYPDWMNLKGTPVDFLIIPIRFIAFLFAPFIPFLVRSFNHLIGVVDGLFYFILCYYLFKNRKIIVKNEMSKAVSIVLLTSAFALSFGASNFGTNIRHRTKILPILLMIPLMNKKERTYKIRSIK